MELEVQGERNVGRCRPAGSLNSGGGAGSGARSRQLRRISSGRAAAQGRGIERDCLPEHPASQWGMRRALLPRLRVEPPTGARSEEHTSELQSLMRISYAVFCLKKKNKPEDPTCIYDTRR